MTRRTATILAVIVVCIAGAAGWLSLRQLFAIASMDATGTAVLTQDQVADLKSGLSVSLQVPNGEQLLVVPSYGMSVDQLGRSTELPRSVRRALAGRYELDEGHIVLLRVQGMTLLATQPLERQWREDWLSAEFQSVQTHGAMVVEGPAPRYPRYNLVLKRHP